jgi:hypothetical protein
MHHRIESIYVALEDISESEGSESELPSAGTTAFRFPSLLAADALGVFFAILSESRKQALALNLLGIMQLNREIAFFGIFLLRRKNWKIEGVIKGLGRNPWGVDFSG